MIVYPTNGSSLIEEQRELRRVQTGVRQLFKKKESNGELASKKRLGRWSPRVLATW